MAIDPHFIPAFSIETVILDKDTGAPLSGGQVSFQEDNQRGVLKPVYQITGTSPAYTYIELPNPMTLSSIGTFEDSLSNPVVPYFYPYATGPDGGLIPDYYYVAVTSFEGVPQFDREAVPYIPDTGEMSIQSIITNEISNPQFAKVLFDTTTASTFTYNFMAATDQVVHLAPDWDLIVTCPASGSVTVGQLTPTGEANIITNPVTLLNITSSGVTSLQLRQRLYGSPNLWGTDDPTSPTYLSASFIAKTYDEAETTLDLLYSQSDGSLIGELIVSATLPASGIYQAFPGSISIPISDSTQTFPNAYVDIYFDLPLNTKIDISSVIVSGTGQTAVDTIVYDQVPLARQTDQLYHYAYPIVPIGTVISFAGFTAPLHYLLCDGTAYSRINYYLLYKALTLSQSITQASTTTFTVTSATQLWVGVSPNLMYVEGAGIPVGTYITNITGSTITVNQATTSTGTFTATFFAYGQGDGASTFNVPNSQGLGSAGIGGTALSSAVSNSLGVIVGSPTHTLLTTELPSHAHPGPAAGSFWVAGAGGTQFANSGASAILQSNTTGNTGSGVAHTIVQPTIFFYDYIRYE